jgi:hypothetical protein
MAEKILSDRGDIKGRRPYLLRNRGYRSGGLSAIRQATNPQSQELLP